MRIVVFCVLAVCIALVALVSLSSAQSSISNGSSGWQVDARQLKFRVLQAESYIGLESQLNLWKSTPGAKNAAVVDLDVRVTSVNYEQLGSRGYKLFYTALVCYVTE